jgi:hypothetical protein
VKSCPPRDIRQRFGAAPGILSRHYSQTIFLHPTHRPRDGAPSILPGTKDPAKCPLLRQREARAVPGNCKAAAKGGAIGSSLFFPGDRKAACTGCQRLLNVRRKQTSWSVFYLFRWVTRVIHYLSMIQPRIFRFTSAASSFYIALGVQQTLKRQIQIP